MTYILLFFWCFLSASIVPFSSEPYYVALIVLETNMIIPLIVGTAGNTLGGISTFVIGKKTGEFGTNKLSERKKRQYERAKQSVQKHGSILLFFSWVPLLGDALVLAGGVLQLPYLKSIVWITIGKFLRYLIIGLITLQIVL